MKTIEEFYNEVMADKALADAAYKARTENRLAEFLAEHEVNGTAEEFNDFVDKKKKANRELSDDELEKASGGEAVQAAWGQEWSPFGSEYAMKDVTYLFNIGDKVIVDCWFRNLYGEVKDRRITKDTCGGTFIFYPEYYIEFKLDTSSDWYQQNYLVRDTRGGGGASGIW